MNDLKLACFYDGTTRCVRMPPSLSTVRSKLWFILRLFFSPCSVHYPQAVLEGLLLRFLRRAQARCACTQQREASHPRAARTLQTGRLSRRTLCVNACMGVCM